MRIDLTLFAAITAFAVGFIAFWSNPRRPINRLFLTLSLHAVVWLLTLRTSFGAEGRVFWLRLSSAIGALIPLHFWLVQQTLSARLPNTLGKWLKHNIGWVLISAALAVAPFTEAFIPFDSSPTHRLRGWAYYGYILLDLGLYVFLFQDAVKQIKKLIGVRRLELHVWMVGGCIIAVVVLALMALTGITKEPAYIRLQPLFILAFYAGTAFAITTHRIFDARQLLLLGLEKAILIVVVAGAAYFLDLAFATILPEPFGLLGTTALALWLAVTLNGYLNRIFHFYPEDTAARQAAFAVARREMRIDHLEKAFIDILKGWGQSEHALILSGGKDALRGKGIELAADSAPVEAMRHLRWATPERLMRERSSPGREALAQFLRENNVGALVIGEGPSLTALVGVGVAVSRRPFTYPQVTQLLELASIMENSLERAHFSVKAQHAEQLATVGLLGASLAHEIRNPLVTIKTFVQLLPKHHQDPAFRDKFFSLIGEEVTRIDRLTEQLLDLAAPRTYSAKAVDLHPVLNASIELVTAKAEDKKIQVRTDFQANPDRAFTDESAAKQVLLNLCLNAIQAVDAHSGAERWVKVSTRNLAGGIEMAVEDSGPGIAPGILPKLFQPFQSTKSSGFGLGLAICSDILAGLNATIAADPPVSGRGATFRVTFPCQPFSS